MPNSHQLLSRIVSEQMDALLDEWIKQQKESVLVVTEGLTDKELRSESSEFLKLFAAAAAGSPDDSIADAAWDSCKSFLAELSSRRAQQGLMPTQTAKFIFALKKPIFHAMRGIATKNTSDFVEQIWRVSLLLDQLGLYIAETSILAREKTIEQQRDEMMELSTPVVQLWPGILAMPLIGTLDSSRAQTVTEALLESIVEENADIAILDITGVPMVDTQVAQHLLKTVAAARLMGAECYVSGIRPQIAQTIVHLGVELSEVTTRATLSVAFRDALKKLNINLATPR